MNQHASNFPAHCTMTQPLTKTVAYPRLLFRPDPVLGWALSANHGVKVNYRKDVIQTIGPDGWRNVPHRSDLVGPRVAIYGCSFTYGTGLTDEETFTAQLQQALPEACVLNRGIGGQGTVQNYLQFRRDIAADAVDVAVFAIISDHRFRNIAHPARMRQYLSSDWHQLGVEHIPVIARDGAGHRRINYVPIQQPALKRNDFDVFLPDDRMLTDATLSALEMVQEIAKDASLPVHFVLLDCLDPDFNAAVLERLPTASDISVPSDKAHTFWPHDWHPNTTANALYADRLLPIVQSLTAQWADQRVGNGTA